MLGRERGEQPTSAIYERDGVRELVDEISTRARSVSKRLEQGELSPRQLAENDVRIKHFKAEGQEVDIVMQRRDVRQDTSRNDSDFIRADYCYIVWRTDEKTTVDFLIHDRFEERRFEAGITTDAELDIEQLRIDSAEIENRKMQQLLGQAGKAPASVEEMHGLNRLLGHVQRTANAV